MKPEPELLTDKEISRARFLASCQEPTFRGESYVVNKLCEEIAKIVANRYETVIIPERIKQAKKELIEKIENHNCEMCEHTNDACLFLGKSCYWWQQLKKEEGIE